VLRPLRERFKADAYPDLLVGLDAPDDAAVWRLDEERLLVMTTDFFTPIVDDPYDYGLIAGANALSDVYAMGATPFLALIIACVPVDLPSDIVLKIFEGLADIVYDSGAVIAGGHTIQDPEPKVGLVALGFASPNSMMTKAGAKPGDKLVLTKPIGTGIVATALKASRASPEHAGQAVTWMKRLNDTASEIAQQHSATAATDITGFGLLGHGLEMAQASEVRLELEVNAIPFLAGSMEYARAGFVPGGTADNRSYFSHSVKMDSSVPEAAGILLFDAQTSGGLLLSVAEENLDELVRSAETRGFPLWIVGSVDEGNSITVVRGEGPRGSSLTSANVEYTVT
jgi:selenide,water dikinase